MKTLYSCGCSFMSIDTMDHGITSFLDLYASQRGLRHVSLARSGATNFLIRLQIEEAIRQNADYIIISATSSDRIDIPIMAKEKEIYCPVQLSDVEYSGYRSASANNIVTDPKIISDSISNWVTDFYTWVFHDNFRRREIPQAQIEAMKQHVSFLHNSALEQTKDYYIIGEGLRKLLALGKPFVFMPGPMSTEWCNWQFVGDSLWQGDHPWNISATDSDSVNHHNQTTHNMFLQKFLEQTPEWQA